MSAGGEIERYKARLVARGYKQEYGIDYFDTYASVVRCETVRLFFAICSAYNLFRTQFDVITAFLNGELDEDLYLSPPEGIQVDNNKVLKLKKSIYGLKQAPKCWQEKLNSILADCNLSATHADTCMYHGVYDNAHVLLIIYVDDGIAASSNKQALVKLIDKIGTHLQMKLLDNNCVVGFQVIQNDDSSIILHQSRYILKILDQYNMIKCKEVSVPINDVEHLLEEGVDDKSTKAPYRELIGALNYAACLTRIDIVYAVNILSRFCNNPKEKHWTAAKAVLRYFKGSATCGITFHSRGRVEIACYSDSDWGGDTKTRKSTSGIIIECCHAPIIYKSRQQTIIASSTTEAEYIAANVVVKELYWLNSLLSEINIHYRQPPLYIDNQAALRIIETKEFRAKTKHIDIKYHYIQMKYKEKLFELKYIPTEKQKADILTKSLPPIKHKNMCKLIGIQPIAKPQLMLMISLSLLSLSAFATLQHEDPMIWTRTDNNYVDGQIDWLLKLVSYDPCPLIYGNITGIPKIDSNLSTVC